MSDSQEFEIDLVATAPNVAYEIVLITEALSKHTSRLTSRSRKIEEIREPYIRLTIFLPADYVGKAMKLCQDRRGEYVSLDYITTERVRLVYDLPLAEFIADFHDRLKSLTRGYASIDYEHVGYRKSDLVKVDVLIHGEPSMPFLYLP